MNVYFVPKAVIKFRHYNGHLGKLLSMRNERTKYEKWAIAQLLPLLKTKGESWVEDPDIHDAPDLVLEDHATNKRIACEVTTVGLNQWHRWANDPNLQLDVDKLDEIVCPREPDYWLKMVLDSKNPKIPSYLKNANASEAWLLIHGDMHDLFFLDDDYDVPVMQQVAPIICHQFTRIYVASSQSKSCSIAQVFPATPGTPEPPDLSLRTNIMALQIRSVKVNALKNPVVGVKIGMEFTPDRQLKLPMLDDTRK